MAVDLGTYEGIKTEIKTLYNELLTGAQENIFYKSTVENIQEAINNLAISEDKKADSLIGFYGQLATNTVAKTFDQAIAIVDRGAKLPLELSKMDKEVDIATEQENELKESVLDRQSKRPLEVANLTKQGTLIDGQVNKMTEDTLYVIAQKESMLEQVEHNKIIKAMDSMGDMVGTLGTGGLIPNTEMFKVYFELNKQLTNVALPTNYTVTAS
jgi:hypothetical protein